MRVFTHEERPRDIFARAVLADRLRNGENMRFIERVIEGTTAVAAGAEADQLLRVFRVGLALVVGFFEPGNIYQDIGGRGLSRQGMNGHVQILSRAASH